MGSGLSMASVTKIKELSESREYSLAVDILDSQDLSKSLNPQFVRLCGVIYSKVGRYKDARRMLIMAHRLAPEAKRVMESFVELYMKMGFRDLVKTYYDIYMFDADLNSTETRQLEYLWGKYNNKPTDEIIDLIYEPYSHELDYDWSYETILCLLVLERYADAEPLIFDYRAKYKDSDNSKKIEDLLVDNDFLMKEFINFNEQDKEDDDPEMSVLREEEKLLLANDDLRIHPREPEIIIMVEDDEEVEFGAKRKMKKFLKEEKKRKKAAEQAADEEKEAEEEAVTLEELAEQKSEPDTVKEVISEDIADVVDSGENIPEDEVEVNTQEVESKEEVIESNDEETESEETETETDDEEIEETTDKKAVGGFFKKLFSKMKRETDDEPYDFFEDYGFSRPEDRVEEMVDEISDISVESDDGSFEENIDSENVVIEEQYVENELNENVDDIVESEDEEVLDDIQENITDDFYDESEDEYMREIHLDKDNKDLKSRISIEFDDDFTAEADTVDGLKDSEDYSNPFDSLKTVKEKKKSIFDFDDAELEVSEESDNDFDDFSESDIFDEFDSEEEVEETNETEETVEEVEETVETEEIVEEVEETDETEETVEEVEETAETEEIAEESEEAIAPEETTEAEEIAETETVEEIDEAVEAEEIEAAVEVEEPIEEVEETIVSEEEVEEEAEAVETEEIEDIVETEEFEQEIEDTVEADATTEEALEVEETETVEETEQAVDVIEDFVSNYEKGTKEKTERINSPKLDFPVFRSSLFPEYNSEVKTIQNNFKDVMDEEQKRIKENLLREEQMQREAEELLASLGIDLSSITPSSTGLDDINVSLFGGLSREELMKSLVIDSSKKEILKKLKEYR